MVFARLVTGGTIKHLNMWGTLVNSTMSLAALPVLRHGDVVPQALTLLYVLPAPSTSPPACRSGSSRAAEFSSKMGIPIPLSGLLLIAFCQSLQLLPAPSEIHKTRTAQQRRGAQETESLGNNCIKYNSPILELSEDWRYVEVFLDKMDLYC